MIQLRQNETEEGVRSSCDTAEYADLEALGMLRKDGMSKNIVLCILRLREWSWHD